MALNKNPYAKWARDERSADYRSTTTQVFSAVRQLLSQENYLRDSNRVNPGPWRNARVAYLEQFCQEAHDLRNEDMWGWQGWADPDSCRAETPLADNLLSECTELDIVYGGECPNPPPKPECVEAPSYASSNIAGVYNNPEVELTNGVLQGLFPSAPNYSVVVNTSSGNRVYWQKRDNEWVLEGSVNNAPNQPCSTNDCSDDDCEGLTFNQLSASPVWTINHNFGHLPLVTLYNTGRQEIDADITHTSLNQVVVTFAIPVAGFARLI